MDMFSARTWHVTSKCHRRIQTQQAFLRVTGSRGPNGCHLDSHQRLMRQEGRAMLLRRSIQRIEALLRPDLPVDVTGIDFLNELWINGFPHILWLELLALTTVSFTPGWMPLASMSSTHHPSALAAGMRFKPLKPTDRAWQPIWSNLQSTVIIQYETIWYIQICSPVRAHTFRPKWNV